jgi:hypothetical protein
LENRPFALIGVNTNGFPPAKLKIEMEKEKISWRSFADPRDAKAERSITDRWNLAGTPTLYILDHNGVIRYRWLGAPRSEIIDKALTRLIKEAEIAAKGKQER